MEKMSLSINEKYAKGGDILIEGTGFYYSKTVYPVKVL